MSRHELQTVATLMDTVDHLVDTFPSVAQALMKRENLIQRLEQLERSTTNSRVTPTKATLGEVMITLDGARRLQDRVGKAVQLEEKPKPIYIAQFSTVIGKQIQTWAKK